MHLSLFGEIPSDSTGNLNRVSLHSVDRTGEAGKVNADKRLELEIENVAEVALENRNFLQLRLGGEDYRALVDPGAVLSLVNTWVANRFAYRLERSTLLIRDINRGIKKVEGRCGSH